MKGSTGAEQAAGCSLHRQLAFLCVEQTGQSQTVGLLVCGADRPVTDSWPSCVWNSQASHAEQAAGCSLHRQLAFLCVEQTGQSQTVGLLVCGADRPVTDSWPSCVWNSQASHAEQAAGCSLHRQLVFLCVEQTGQSCGTRVFFNRHELAIAIRSVFLERISM